jgi:hypothetical protein
MIIFHITFQVHEVESVECGWDVKDPYNGKQGFSATCSRKEGQHLRKHLFGTWHIPPVPVIVIATHFNISKCLQCQQAPLQWLRFV